MYKVITIVCSNRGAKVQNKIEELVTFSFFLYLRTVFLNLMEYKQRFNEQRALRFRQFTRKPWALFACLGRVVTIGVLSVATLQSASAATDDVATKVEHADEGEPDKEMKLDDLEVTGSLAPLTTGQGVRVVTVLSREDIQAAPVQSINDVLKLVSGVDVRQRGPIGAQTDVSIRGGTQEQIAILLNGINICDPQTGHNTFDLPCDISDIVRIELLEGPAGRVYGTSSLVGAINVVTVSGGVLKGEKSVQARIEGGSYGYAGLGFRYYHPSLISPHTSNISTSITRSDGYQRSKAGRLNADYKGAKTFYQGAYEMEDIRIDWYAGISTKGYGSNTFYSARYDEQFEKNSKLFTAIRGEMTGRLHLKPAVYWNRTYDRFELIRGSEDKVPFNRHCTDVLGLNINGWFDWRWGRTALGAEFRNEDIVSTNLGEPLNKPTDSYKYGLNRSNLSFHMEHNVLVKRLTISAGFFAIKNTWNEMPFTLYPGIDASYRLNSHTRVYASFNSSLRMPSFTELYYSVGGHKADKYLKPEELKAVEGGIKVDGGKVRVDGKVFYYHCRNIIDWVMDTRDRDAIWQSVNHTKLNTLGQEISLYSRLSTLNFQLSYCHLHQQKQELPYLQSQYSLEYLRHKMTAMVQWHISRRLSTTLCYRFQDRTGSYTSTEGVVTEYPPYSIVDSRIVWKRPQTELYAEVNNLFGSHYVDYGNVAQPGCWIIVGCKKTLNNKKRISISQ